jgi:hypothetical protein
MAGSDGNEAGLFPRFEPTQPPANKLGLIEHGFASFRRAFVNPLVPTQLRKRNDTWILTSGRINDEYLSPAKFQQ